MKAFAKVTHNVKVALDVESIIVPKVFHQIAIAAHHHHVMQVRMYLSKIIYNVICNFNFHPSSLSENGFGRCCSGNFKCGEGEGKEILHILHLENTHY